MTVDPALAVRGISKAFGGELALDNVSFTLARGEIHGLLGENGSGKSTLIKVLSGFHAPDSGELDVHGESVSLPLAPGQFRDLGLEFVHQDLGLVRSLTVTENLLVGDMVEPRRRWNWSSSRQHHKAREILERYNVDIDPTRQVGEFRPLEQAMIAIVRAVEGLRRGAAADGHGVARRILVLDEPTVFLPRDGADVLFGLLNDVVSQGASVIFVSHKLSEVCQITDRFTVLRDGRVVGTEQTAGTDTTSIVRMIVGHDVETTRRQQSVAKSTEAAARVERVAGDRLAPMSFDVRVGEIVGVTGLVGAGFEELPYLLFGVGASRTGTVRVNGATYDLARLDPARAIRAGIALVPADRKRDGGVLDLTVGENLTLPVLDRYTRGPFLSGRAMRREARPTLERFSVTPSDPTFLYSALSGGNQQKVLLAKWLQIAPKLLLLHEPTQGVDVGAREQLHALVREGAAAGMAVICVGSDHEQIALLCNRVLIVADGHVVDELAGDEITDQRITTRCYTSTSMLAGEQAGGHALVVE